MPSNTIQLLLTNLTLVAILVQYFQFLSSNKGLTVVPTWLFNVGPIYSYLHPGCAKSMENTEVSNIVEEIVICVQSGIRLYSHIERKTQYQALFIMIRHLEGSGMCHVMLNSSDVTRNRRSPSLEFFSVGNWDFFDRCRELQLKLCHFFQRPTRSDECLRDYSAVQKWKKSRFLITERSVIFPMCI